MQTCCLAATANDSRRHYQINILTEHKHSRKDTMEFYTENNMRRVVSAPVCSYQVRILALKNAEFFYDNF